MVAVLANWSGVWTTASLFGLKWSDRGTIVLMFGALVLAVIMGTWTGAVAAGKGFNMQLWFIIGFFLPVIGLILVYLARPREKTGGS